MTNSSGSVSATRREDDASWSLALTKVAERLRAIGVGLGIQDMKTHEFRSLGYVGMTEA